MGTRTYWLCLAHSGAICLGCKAIHRKDKERAQQRLQLAIFYLNNCQPTISVEGKCPCKLCDLMNESKKQQQLRLRYEPYPATDRKTVAAAAAAAAAATERSSAANGGVAFSISHQQIDYLKRKNSFSDKTTLSLLSDLRYTFGNRFLIERNYRLHCTARNKSLQHLFVVTESEGSKGVVCNDVSALIDLFMDARGLTSADLKLKKICIDQGEINLPSRTTENFREDSTRFR